jgi:hypothetical protein
MRRTELLEGLRRMTFEDVMGGRERWARCASEGAWGLLDGLLGKAGCGRGRRGRCRPFIVSATEARRPASTLWLPAEIIERQGLPCALYDTEPTQVERNEE